MLHWRLDPSNCVMTVKSDTALLLLLPLTWSVSGSPWQLQRCIWPRICGLRQLCRFCVCCCSLRTLVSTNERCAFEEQTSQLIKIGADGGVKVNCLCNVASAVWTLPNPLPAPSSVLQTLILPSMMETRLPVQNCRPDKNHWWPSELKKPLSLPQHQQTHIETQRQLKFLFVLTWWLSELLFAESEHISAHKKITVAVKYCYLSNLNSTFLS